MFTKFEPLFEKKWVLPAFCGAFFFFFGGSMKLLSEEDDSESLESEEPLEEDPEDESLDKTIAFPEWGSWSSNNSSSSSCKSSSSNALESVACWGLRVVARNLFRGGSRGGEAAGAVGSSFCAFPTTIEMGGFVGTERFVGSLKSTQHGMTSSIALPLLPVVKASPHLNNRAHLQWFWLF